MTTTTIKPFVRRSGGLGVHGVYAEATANDGSTLKAFLVADVIGTQILVPGAGGATWKFPACADATDATNRFALFFADLPITAVALELTNIDVDRLRQADRKMTSAVYRIAPILAAAREEAAAT